MGGDKRGGGWRGCEVEVTAFLTSLGDNLSKFDLKEMIDLLIIRTLLSSLCLVCFDEVFEGDDLKGVPDVLAVIWGMQIGKTSR